MKAPCALFLPLVLAACSTATPDNGYYRTVASPAFAAQGERIPPTVGKLQKSNQPTRPTMANPPTTRQATFE